MNINSVEQMYNELDLATLSLFEGGFINFGYWKNCTASDRLKSEQDLYRIVLDQLLISQHSSLLEVGCGQGAGTQFIFNNYRPQHITGLDFSAFQINKAQEINKHTNVNFIKACAEQMPFASNTFDTIVSIQTAHYFNSFFKFCQESYRILTPEGSLGIATYFLNDKIAHDQLKKLIPTVNNNVEKPIAIQDATMHLKDAGFNTITIESIGEHVWHGFDQWSDQLPEFKNSWGRNWYHAYQQNLVDYYIIIAH